MGEESQDSSCVDSSPAFLASLVVLGVKNPPANAGCLCEIRDTVELGVTSRNSTGFGEMEKGIIFR